mgnify:CR=1 FL=1
MQVKPSIQRKSIELLKTKQQIMESEKTLTDNQCNEIISKRLSSTNWDNYYEDNLTKHEHLQVLLYNKRILEERDGLDWSVFDNSINTLNAEIIQQ